MIIHWKPNPFYTKVELDKRDKLMLLAAYQNEQYTDLLCSLDMQLRGEYKEPALTDLEVIQKTVGEWKEICNLEVDSEEIQMYISYLDTTHDGDCICVPASCIRCQVEDLLGINTLKGLGKHSARKVLGAFGKDGNKTIDEAITTLEETPSYIKPDTWPDTVGWDIHIPRWEKERHSAAEWLRKYKEEHSF